MHFIAITTTSSPGGRGKTCGPAPENISIVYVTF
jgi:hypothetical protein